MPVIAILIAALAGGTWAESFFGAVVGGLLAWLGLRSRAQQRQILALQEAIRQARAADTAATPAAAPTAPVLAAVSTPAPTPVSTAVAAIPPAPQAPVRPSARATPTPTAPPAAPTLWDQGLAWLVGGNTIAKAGVGILFIGLAFLAKYASEHALLPVEFRLAGIAAVALVLLGLGWRLRAARPGYAQVLQGGAVAVLYLTLFVAFRFYGVLAAGPVFTLMVAVAGLAAALAVLQDARSLAVIGAVGGFATPLLVSTGSGNHLALFSYYLVLDLGIAAVAWFRNWRLLHAVGAVFTFGVAAAWGVLKYEPAHYAQAQGFLIAYFLLFTAVLLMPARQLARSAGRVGAAGGSDTWVNGGLLFGVPTVVFALQHALVRDMAYGTALSALALAAFYVLLATRLRRSPALAVLFDAALAIATVFISLVIPFALDARSTGGAWALEGAGLLWLGFRQQRRVPRCFGHALLLLAGATLVMAHQWHAAPQAFFNPWFLNALLLAVAAVAGAFFVHRGTAGRPDLDGEAATEGLWLGWGLLWALGAAALQIERFATGPQRVSAWLLALSLIALGCTGASLRLRWPLLGRPLLALAPAWLLLALVSALWLDAPTAHGGWWAWPLALGVQALVLQRLVPGWPPRARRAVHAMGPLLLAVLGAHAGGAITRGWGDTASAWPWLGTLVVPALLLVCLPRATTARQWPVRDEPVAYQALAGAVLANALLLWTLLANALSEGTARPLPHVPLLNPLDLGVAAALSAVWLWLRHPTPQAQLARVCRTLLALLAGLGFFWLNAMLLRAFHHWAGVPYALSAWTASLPVQTGVTLLWSVTALGLMWGSARRALRTPWLVGATLLAAVVAKLLLVDLSGSGTVTRIVSFMGVGLLMLLIAYVAPWPSNAQETDREAS